MIVGYGGLSPDHFNTNTHVKVAVAITEKKYISVSTISIYSNKIWMQNLLYFDVVIYFYWITNIIIKAVF